MASSVSQGGRDDNINVTPEISAPKVRVSLACVPCRNHHMRCDGGQPVCSACKLNSKQCFYMKSRRGGFDKATLLKKRAEKAEMQTSRMQSSLGSPTQQSITPTGPAIYNANSSSAQGSSNQGIAADDSGQHDRQSSDHGSHYGGQWTLGGMPPNQIQELGPSSNISSQIAGSARTSFSSGDRTWAPSTTPVYSDQPNRISSHHLDQNPLSEKLMDLYYTFLHESHPFVLPRKFLEHHWGLKRSSMQHLMRVIQYCGSLYSSEIDSEPLKQKVLEAALQGNLARNGFTVQAHILLSIALHCWDELEAARAVLDMAINLALSTNMNLHIYAFENGEGSPVLEESWRRTWWSLYISDCLFTGIRGLNTFSLRTVDTSVGLPCDEESYVSGDIPKPPSLAEYDSRDFADDVFVFSSFAYLIDSVRLLSPVFFVAHESGGSFDRVVSNIDAKLVSWTLNLPKEKQQLVGANGKVDELIFQAHVIINTATVHLHRPRSKLATSSLELTSKCAPNPGSGPSPTDLKNVEGLHTAKALVAAKAVITMFTLPTQLVSHSPLILCQLGFSSLAYMSACTFVFKGNFFQEARDLVQVSIGAFKVYADYWPISARTLRQLKATGREVFSPNGSRSANDISGGPPSSFQHGPFATHTPPSSSLGNSLNESLGGDSFANMPSDQTATGLDFSSSSEIFDDIFKLLETSDQSWMWNGSLPA